MSRGLLLPLALLLVLATLPSCDSEEPAVATADAAVGADGDGDTGQDTGDPADSDASGGSDGSGDKDATADSDASGDNDGPTDAASPADVDAADDALSPMDAAEAGADTVTPLPQCATADDGPTQNPCMIGSCTTKGACAYAAKADASPCDDGNPCTDDSCDPKKSGCTYVFNTKPCTDSVGCTKGDTCKSGACVAATTPRYFDKTLQISGNSYEGWDGVVALADGSFLATGRAAPANCGSWGCQMGKKWDSLLARYDAAGTLKWQTSVDYGSYSAGDAEDWLSHPQLLGTGNVAAIGTKGDNAKLLQFQVLVVQPADGKVVGQYVFEGPGQTTARDDVGRALARAVLPVGERLAFTGTQTTGISGMGKEVVVGRLAIDGTADFVARLDEYADQDVSDIKFLPNGWVVTVGTTWHTAGPTD